MLIDPSYEVKTEYAQVPQAVRQIAKVWSVGVMMIWYPILTDRRHMPMVERLQADHPDATVHEVGFPPAREGHGMIGSGLAVRNAPWGFEDAMTALSANFATL